MCAWRVRREERTLLVDDLTQLSGAGIEGRRNYMARNRLRDPATSDHPL